MNNTPNVDPKGWLFSKDSFWATVSIFLLIVSLLYAFYWQSLLANLFPNSFYDILWALNFILGPMGFIAGLIGVIKKERLAWLGLSINFLYMLIPLSYLLLGIA